METQFMANDVYEVDFLVIGSGCGGLTAAVTANHFGLRTLVIEKTEKYGGNSSISGGAVWVPGHFLQAPAGVKDTLDMGRSYLANTVGERTPKARQEAYLQYAVEMVQFLHNNTDLTFHRSPGYSDYFPERPGGLAIGRALEADMLATGEMGQDWENMRVNPLFMGPFFMNATDVPKMGTVMTTWSGKWTAMKVAFRSMGVLIRGQKLLTMGGALVGRLRLTMMKKNIPLWLNSPMISLIYENGKVLGALVEHEKKLVEVRASKGVLLAAGGFERNQELRDRYMEKPIDAKWTAGSPGNSGDCIQAGLSVGAGVDLMEDAWWMPSSILRGEPFVHVPDRAYPSGIMVDMAGKRFMNESSPYTEAVHAMYAHKVDGKPTVPAWFIMDQQMRSKYLWGNMMPGAKFPQDLYESGYVTSANSIPELAEKVKLPAEALEETVKRFNQFARNGNDEDFHRGDSAYDHYYGDPAHKPNPNLGTVEKAPFYAIRIYPGDIGTKGGLLTDEQARVLGKDGTVIEGLFATGNTTASVMGNSYPGPGATIGPSMTFGYVAAKMVAAKKA
jgi:3-oxosteroid 1-dehydrogenase